MLIVIMVTYVTSFIVITLPVNATILRWTAMMITTVRTILVAPIAVVYILMSHGSVTMAMHVLMILVAPILVVYIPI